MSTGGLSRARLGRMHDVMAGYVERGDLPGLVTLVSRRGEVHVDALGTKAVGGSDPIGRDIIFRIASLTKPISVAATMILVEGCKLRLDELVDWSRPPALPSELVSTIDDYLAFGQMLLNKGRHGSERILSRPSVELLTTDQLTPEKAGAGFLLRDGRG